MDTLPFVIVALARCRHDVQRIGQFVLDDFRRLRTDMAPDFDERLAKLSADTRHAVGPSPLDAPLLCQLLQLFDYPEHTNLLKEFSVGFR